MNRIGGSIDAKGAPKVFCVIPGGDSMTDDGPHRMSYADALKVVERFERRGNAMSFDFDHASADTNAPPESRVAAGWIPCPGGLEARNDGSVWTTDVEWTSEVQSWLTEDPPKYRYLSPRYEYVMRDGFAVYTGLINIALTNNPKTWGCTRLASLAAPDGESMNDKDLMLAGAALLALLGLMGAEDASLAEMAKAMDAQMREKLGESADKAMELAAPAKVEPAPESEAGASDAMKEDDKEKQSLASLAAIKAEVKQSAADKAAIEKLIGANKDKIPARALPLLRSASLAAVADFVADISGVGGAASAPVVPANPTTGVRGNVARKEHKERAASLVAQNRIRPEDADKYATMLAGLEG